jgi:tetratricopeptide (TPR) repeat protein
MKKLIISCFVFVVLLFLSSCSGKKKSSAEFNKFLEQGRAKVNSGDFTGALADLNQAVKLNNKSAEAYYWTGRAYMATEPPPYVKTIENYKKAISINSDYALAYCSLATVYDQLKDESKACETATKSMAAFEKQGIKPEDQAVYKQAENLKQLNCK